MLPAGFHVPFSLTKTSPVLVLTKVSPSFPWFSPGFSVPFKISFPSRPSRPAAPVAPATPSVPFVPFVPSRPSVPFVPFSPLSPFGPLILPADFHVPFSLTKISPVSVLTYLSPSFPVSDVGFVFPFKISFPSSPFGPLILPAGFHVPFSLTKISPVLVLTKVSPSLPWFSPGFSVPFKISFPSRPSRPAAPVSPVAPAVPSFPFAPSRPLVPFVPFVPSRPSIPSTPS